QGTVHSGSYEIEIKKEFPQLVIEQEACPMWVPLIENNEQHAEGADYFVKKHINQILQRDPEIDTLLLACTHYPLLKDKIISLLPDGVTLITQGEIVAESLQQYLGRHPEIKTRLSKGGRREFYTTDAVADFDNKASVFFGAAVHSKHTAL
ncbi:MAG: aspartate/glutamate racemase family protein, partial [Flavisolibacter sp.]|nr:aspartate/glutamate racemase family protein [Flavisolibacter sp.]